MWGRPSCRWALLWGHWWGGGWAAGRERVWGFQAHTRAYWWVALWVGGEDSRHSCSPLGSKRTPHPDRINLGERMNGDDNEREKHIDITR